MAKEKVAVQDREVAEQKTISDVMLVARNKPLTENMLASIQSATIINPKDKEFLVENKEHLQKVVDNTWIWRTRSQKYSILHDQYHATAHAKFHQAILENKVFFEQAVELYHQGEEIKFEMEKVLHDLEEVSIDQEAAAAKIKLLVGTDVIGKPEYKKELLQSKRLETKERELKQKLQKKSYALQQLELQMTYRMKEIRDWKEIEMALYEQMREEGMTDAVIWSKESGEAESHFFLFLRNYQNIHQSKDVGEQQNLKALVRYAVDQAFALGKFEEWLVRCDEVQLKSLEDLGYVRRDDKDPTKVQWRSMISKSQARLYGLKEAPEQPKVVKQDPEKRIEQ